jgi:hypothetical protein
VPDPARAAVHAGHIFANTASNYTAYAFFNSKQVRPCCEAAPTRAHQLALVLLLCYQTIAMAMQQALHTYASKYLHLTVETLQIVLVSFATCGTSDRMMRFSCGSSRFPSAL